MLKIGLTGGIGSGKSTVARLFEKHGVPIIDTDEIARDLVRPNQPALKKIVQEFGPDIVAGDGELDRTRLRERVFQDPGAKSRLEAILHPAIFAELKRLAAAIEAPYCIFVIPLLVESNAQSLVDRILVVDCPELLQIARIKSRDRMDDTLIRRILASQASRSERLSQAHDIIVNDGDLGKLEQQVNELHEFYLKLACSSHLDPC